MSTEIIKLLIFDKMAFFYKKKSFFEKTFSKIKVIIENLKNISKKISVDRTIRFKACKALH